MHRSSMTSITCSTKSHAKCERAEEALLPGLSTLLPALDTLLLRRGSEIFLLASETLGGLRAPVSEIALLASGMALIIIMSWNKY